MKMALDTFCAICSRFLVVPTCSMIVLLGQALLKAFPLLAATVTQVMIVVECTFLLFFLQFDSGGCSSRGSRFSNDLAATAATAAALGLPWR